MLRCLSLPGLSEAYDLFIWCVPVTKLEWLGFCGASMRYYQKLNS